MRMTIGHAGLVVGIGLLVAVPTRAVEREAIVKAIQNGVNHIKSNARDGSWGPLGTTALHAWALLECEVPEDDPVIVKAAENIRRWSVGSTATYDISLTILFLDKLNDPADVPLIESLGVRLLEGQRASGGWTYECPKPDTEESRRLDTLVIKRDTALKTRTDVKDGPRRTVNDLAPTVQARLVRLRILAEDPKHKADNSNTQFANLALWVAHRHGVPVADAIGRIALRYRLGQKADGGWDYHSDPVKPGTVREDKAKVIGADGSSATMTCAGLLGLMTARGLLAEQGGGGKKVWDFKNDPALKTGLICLSSVLHKPVNPRTKELPYVHGKSYYFLWGLERICAGLNMPTLGRKDWYGWGADFLIANQQPDGSWKGEYASMDADTCFAMLFLKRANPIHDLTASIGGQMGDVLERALVGGDPRKTKPTPGPSPKEPPDTIRPAASDPPPISSEAEQLAESFLKSPADAQATGLAELRDGKGVQYTEALTAVIGRLDGRLKEQAREALVERLSRMKPDTLRRYLTDEELEIRRAAALASAGRNLKAHIPDLIARLRDRSPDVAAAAHSALQSLSGEKLPADAAAWDAWWKTQK
jgi:hypothetical protein